MKFMRYIVLSSAVLSVASCAMTPAQRAEISSLVTAVEPLVAAYAQTGHVSEAQAIPAALNSLAVFDPSQAVDAGQLAANIESTVNAFTNYTAGSTGQRIASAVLNVLPPNPSGAQVNAALAQASIGAGNGAGGK